MLTVITGACGFLGRALVERLNREEGDVIAIGRSPVLPEQLRDLGNTRFLSCDIVKNKKALKGIPDPDAISS